jgi:hypothetical protein
VLRFAHEGDDLALTIDWPAGFDLSSFARALALLAAGRLNDALAAAARKGGHAAGEPSNGEDLARFLEDVDEDLPVVRADRAVAKLLQGNA